MSEAIVLIFHWLIIQIQREQWQESEDKDKTLPFSETKNEHYLKCVSQSC
jgi:hypothetical protein